MAMVGSEWVTLNDELDVNANKLYPGTGKFGDSLPGQHKTFGQVVVKHIISSKKSKFHQSGVTFTSLNQQIGNILEKIDHKNIIKILGHFLNEEGIWIIYEFCKFMDLHNFLKLRHKAAHISGPECIDIMAQCSEGLTYLHKHQRQPIIHCDLHPGNILFKEDNGGYVVKVTDYLMATVFEGNLFEKKSITESGIGGSSSLSQSGIQGKVYNTAPEYLDNESTSQPKESFDVFCMGVIFHTILSHETDALDETIVPVIPGWAGTSIAEYVKSNSEPNLFGASADSVENQLHTVIEGMLCRDPDDRPPIKSVAEQLQALKRKEQTTQNILEEEQTSGNKSNSEEKESSQKTTSEKEECSQNSFILKKITHILQQQGPMDATDGQIIDLLTDCETRHILKTAGSVDNFVSQFCSTINIEDGLLMYKPADVKGPVLDPDKVTKMANIMCEFMHLLEQDTATNQKIRGSYFNAFNEKIYLHVPVEDQSEVKMCFEQQLQYKKYRRYIQIQDDEELLAKPFANRPGILSYLGLGCRLMNDDNLVVHGMAQDASHWTLNLTDHHLALGYGTLGAFAQNTDNNHVFALSARHILDVAANDSVNIISFTQDEKDIKKTDSVVIENLKVSMQESVFLGNDFIGLLGIKDGKLVDVAIIGPFPDTFTQCHKVYQPQRAHRVTSRTDYHNWSHKKVKIVGATSGLSKGRVIASSRIVTAKTPERGTTIDAKTFLVASYDEGTGQWKGNSYFAERGDSGSVVFLDDDEEAAQGLQALGLVHGSLKLVTLGGHTYRNVVVCAYMDVCMEALQREYSARYGGQLDLLEYSYIPEWRLKQQNAQQPPNHVAGNMQPGFQLSPISSVVGIRQFSASFQRNQFGFWFWSILLAVCAIVFGILLLYHLTA